MLILLLVAASAAGHCVAVDGDTLSCVSMTKTLRRTPIRLNGIDSPELPGHCRAPRVCAPGDPVAAKDALKELVAGRTVKWRSLGRDKYGRTIAQPKADGVDLSCSQLEHGHAIYKPQWDNRRGVARACPAVAK